MSSFGFLLLCIQACLVQNVFSQACIGAYAPAALPTSPCGYGTGLSELAYPAGLGLASAYPGNLGYTGAYPGAAGYGAAYGGAGEGNVAVAGELPVCGNTAVAGQVPIMGAVNFGGALPAAGAVSISGKCTCGCGTPYDYRY